MTKVLITYFAKHFRETKHRRMSWAEYVARIEEVRYACSILGGRSDDKGPFGRPRHGPKWKGKTK
jgi:hypothetical protein